MTDLKSLQRRILKNKKKQGFDTTNIDLQFLFIYGEITEAYEAWRKKKEDLNEELADIAIYVLGLAEMLGIDLGAEIDKKMTKNEKRKYKKINGVMTRVGGNTKSNGEEK